ncbi:DUF4224 domain-containing protein [Cupriavidus basilensis]
MTDEDLQELTGKKRWSAQARWLEAAFRIERRCAGATAG